MEAFMTDRQIQAFIIMQLQQDAQCCGISMAQCHALLEIAERDSTSVSELAENMSLDKSTLSRTVDGLVNEGWVQRAVKPGNRRAQVLTLASSGKNLSDRIHVQCNDLYRRLLDRLPPNKIAQVLASLELLGQALHDDYRKNQSACAAPGGTS
jgi:DNA-binding MarR family transcriptional regulator